MNKENERIQTMLRAVAIAAGASCLVGAVLITAGFAVLAGKISFTWLPWPELVGMGAVLVGCVYAGVGVGLGQRRGWALYAGLVTGVAGLALVPAGTVLSGVGLFFLYRVRGDYDLMIDTEPDEAAAQEICPYCARSLPDAHPLRAAA